MVISFTTTLPEALQKIEHGQHYYELIVHHEEQERTWKNADEIIERYGQAKWKIIDVLNNYYNPKLKEPFNPYNWLEEKKNDEVAYFLSEAGSNTLNYSQFKAPWRFHLWLGEKGFIIGIEQKGKSFPAQEIVHQEIKTNEGAAFAFFKHCRNRIFFDNTQHTRIIYMEHTFDNVSH